MLEQYIEKVNKTPKGLQRLWLPQKVLNNALMLQQTIGHNFKDITLLLEALTHRSAISDFLLRNSPEPDYQMKWNERLEFLGDSALNLVMTTWLWKKYPETKEGQLSRLRATMVNEVTLAEIGRKISIGQCVALGFGEEKNGGRERDALIADVLEATFGAIYLDAGFGVVTKVVESLYTKFVTPELQSFDLDYKTKLQEHIQEISKVTPTYIVTKEFGPDHSKEFEVGVMVDNEIIATGVGASKKRASQLAAKNALIKLNKL